MEVELETNGIAFTHHEQNLVWKQIDELNATSG